LRVGLFDKISPLTLVPVGLLVTAEVWAKCTPGPASSPIASVQVERIAQVAATTSGEPILAPHGKLEVSASRYHIPVSATLPEHMHPFPRFGFVLAGTLAVTSSENGTIHLFHAGDFIAEDVARWHSARNAGEQQVDLLVLDITEPGGHNVTLK